MGEKSRPLEYTPTWVVAAICTVIVFISFCAERGLHRLGKCLLKRNRNLYEALQKLKEELMLLGFISLLLTVSQDSISHICVPTRLASYMLPCKLEDISSYESILKNSRRFTSEISGLEHCPHEGKLPVLSLDAVHELHIFIFVLALVHVVFAATTVVLGGAKMKQWKNWEDSLRSVAVLQDGQAPNVEAHHDHHHHHHSLFVMRRVIMGHYRKLPVVRWVRSFFKQFYGSVTESDYIALRWGFIKEHCPSSPEFHFHGYMERTLMYDFKQIVGISWYLWVFVVIFLLLNIQGWHTYFWISYLPLVLLLLVGAKLEHIITRLARDAEKKRNAERNETTYTVKPSDQHFCFKKPGLVLYLIQFILFQNSFEIAFFIWIWGTHGFKSCVMEKLGFIIPRLVVGVIVQVLCSYITLPLYVLVTQMGSRFKAGIFNDYILGLVEDWAEGSRQRVARRASPSPKAASSQMQKLENQSFRSIHLDEDVVATDHATVSSSSDVELSCSNQNQIPSP